MYDKKTVSTKKVTWNDYLYPDKIEKRDITNYVYLSRANGRSGFECACPFCTATVFVTCWRGEKRCENCGAILTTLTSAFAFQLKDRIGK